MVRRRQSARFAAIFAALIAIAISMWQQRGDRPAEPGNAPASPKTERRVDVPPSVPAPAPQPGTVAPPADRQQESQAGSRLDGVVRDADEKRIALETLALIERGGPFPHRKDGTVFSNRERRLPARPRGYYREYTVPTPGEDDRGARRIVRGADGDAYYTRDHYRTFVKLTP